MGGIKTRKAEHQVRAQAPHQGHERVPFHACTPWGCSSILMAWQNHFAFYGLCRNACLILQAVL